MATDGPKIIDGDLAHDTYWGIMDLYDSNADLITIQKEIPFLKHNYGLDDDFHHEVFVTSYAMAFWEIGALTDEILNEVRSVVELGIGVRYWNSVDPKAGQLKQKELEKLLKKISVPNIKIRKPKKYRQVTSLYFREDDLLCFKLKDNFYRALICTGIYQYRGRCEYIFVPTTYKSLNQPETKDLVNFDILGVKIGSGYNVETTKSMQPGVEAFWNIFPDKIEPRVDTTYFFIGLVQYLIPHKELIHFKNNFQNVGTLKIKPSLKTGGSSGLVTDFNDLEDSFINQEENLKIFRQYKFPIKMLCEL